MEKLNRNFEERIDKYIIKNENEYLFSKDEILKLFKKWVSGSPIVVHKNRWTKHIPQSEVLLGISTKQFCVIFNKSHFVMVIQGVLNHPVEYHPLIEFNKLKFSKSEIFYDGVSLGKYNKLVDPSIYQETCKGLYEELIFPYINDVNDELLRKEVEKKEQEELQELHRLTELKESQSNVLSELDKDGNGEVDVIEGNDFNQLLKKHQKSIVEIDKNFVQQFVKISSYLKTKEKNIQSIFNSIKNTPNQEVLNEYVEILKGDIHSYNLILFNSLNMIVSLVEDEMITFYEIHEQFDTLNMFDSKHEKDISQKLSDIGDGLENLIYEIRDMSDSINNSIGELSYVTEDSNRQLTERLSEINSSIGVNNFLTGIQTYQMYKINKNTKSLRG